MKKRNSSRQNPKPAVKAKRAKQSVTIGMDRDGHSGTSGSGSGADQLGEPKPWEGARQSVMRIRWESYEPIRCRRSSHRSARPLTPRAAKAATAPQRGPASICRIKTLTGNNDIANEAPPQLCQIRGGFNKDTGTGALTIEF
jgi:hypothetical protein